MDRSYRIATQQLQSVDNVSYVLLETQLMKNRQHRRMIGSDPSQGALYGRPLLYADLYSLVNQREYVYCGHRTDPGGFFVALDRFLGEQLNEFPELRNRRFRVVLSGVGEFVEHELTPPFSRSLPIDPNLLFARCYFPFGDVAISFGTPTISQEFTCLKSGFLCSTLESPLVGADMTKSSILVKLLARLHWAAGVISDTILEHLIEQLSLNPVAA